MIGRQPPETTGITARNLYRLSRSTVSIHIVHNGILCHIHARAKGTPHFIIYDINDNILCAPGLCRRGQSTIECRLCRARV